jgi:hypothetical protein
MPEITKYFPDEPTTVKKQRRMIFSIYQLKHASIYIISADSPNTDFHHVRLSSTTKLKSDLPLDVIITGRTLLTKFLYLLHRFLKQISGHARPEPCSMTNAKYKCADTAVFLNRHAVEHNPCIKTYVTHK